MRNKWTGCNKFTVTLISGKEVTAEVEATFINERNYGADADGNRGIPMTFLEDINLTVPITDPEWNEDDHKVPLTEDEKKEAETLLIKVAEEYDWEEQADDEMANVREKED